MRVSSDSLTYSDSVSVSQRAIGSPAELAHRCTHSSLPLPVESPRTRVRDPSPAKASRASPMDHSPSSDVGELLAGLDSDVVVAADPEPPLDRRWSTKT